MAFTQFATDDFTRANSGTLGANWTDQAAGIGIVSNQANGSGSGIADYMVSYYSAVTPADDQASIATVVLASATNDRSVGVTVRASGTGGTRNFYWLLVNDVTSFLFKVISGTPTLLQNISSIGFSAGDRLKLEIVGDDLTAYRALAATPTVFVQIGSVQPAGGELTSGHCGITLSQFPSTGNSGILDSWEGEQQTSALASGDASLADVNDTTITVEVGKATGGTEPYTYQWYRDTVANFTPSGGNLQSGATSQTFADSTGLSAFTPYFYKCITTDDVAATAISNQTAGALFSAPLILYALGDSITKSTAGPTPPSVTFPELLAIELAKIYRQRDVTVVNGGVDGASAVDYANDVGGILTDAVSDAVGAGAQYVSILLGANDAANHETDTDFSDAMETIIAAFAVEDIPAILHVPTYFPSLTNEPATAFLQSYLPKIQALINGSGVLQGDILAYQYFIDHYQLEAQADNTHLKATGEQSLAVMQARAIDRYVIQPCSGGTFPGFIAPFGWQ